MIDSVSLHYLGPVDHYERELNGEDYRYLGPCIVAEHYQLGELVKIEQVSQQYAIRLLEQCFDSAQAH